MKWVAYITVTLIAILMILIVGSWIVSAVMPEAEINSMLSGEGIRWFVGHSMDTLASRLLVWLLLIAIATGVAKESHIAQAIGRLIHRQQMSYYERLGLQSAFIVACLMLAIVLYLIAAPNAVLLSATGQLIPSAFAAGVIPILCLLSVMVAGTYGFIARSFLSLTAFIEAMCQGVSLIAPFIIIYIVAAQLVACVAYIFL